VTRSQIHAGIAFGSILVLASVAVLAPAVPPASAEMQASRICREQGITTASAGYDICLWQAEKALEGGEPEIARALARVTAEAREACRSRGLEATTGDYRVCMERETKVRSLLVFSDEKLKFGPQLARPE
jgi:hypothetical protein